MLGWSSPAWSTYKSENCVTRTVLGGFVALALLMGNCRRDKGVHRGKAVHMLQVPFGTTT